MSTLIPVIGASGIFPVKAPFNTKISAFDIYTCQAIRRMSDILAEPSDPYALYYAPLGISEDEYKIDLDNNVCILSLQSGMGNWVFVPNSYLLSLPLVNGIRYTSMVINVALGPLPDHEPLDLIKKQISDVVLDTLGITAVVKEAAVSNTSVIPTNSHEIFLAKRLIKGKTVAKTDTQKLREAQEKMRMYESKIADLENYIRTKLPK